jgi:hypothetical protein
MIFLKRLVNVTVVKVTIVLIISSRILANHITVMIINFPLFLQFIPFFFFLILLYIIEAIYA